MSLMRRAALEPTSVTMPTMRAQDMWQLSVVSHRNVADLN